MKQKKADLRYIKTKERILKALEILLMKKDFEKITVKDICEEAMISRSAFYLHYEDKYLLVESYQQEFLTKLNDLSKEKLYQDVEPFLISLLQLLKQEGKLMTLLLAQNGAWELQAKIKKALQKNMEVALLPRIKNVALNNTVEREYFISYITNAQFGILQNWLARGQQETPEELARIISQINKFEIE